MPEVASLLDAIEARLNTVTNIGQVHDRIRFNADWSTFLDQLKSTVTTDKIRAWMINLKEGNDEPGAFAANNRHLQFEVWGIHSFSDSQNSAAAFVALTELVLDALAFRTDLGVAAVIDFSVGGVNYRFEERMVGSVLCHSVTIAMTVTVRKSGTYA